MDQWHVPDNHPKTREVRATVVALLPEFQQVQLRSADGHLFALTEHTSGVRWTSLHEGQQVQCTVTLRQPRVLRAQLVA